MKSFFKITLASFIGAILAGIIVILIFFTTTVGIISSASTEEPVELDTNTILKLKLNKKIVDRGSKNPFEGFDFVSMQPQKTLGLNTILKNIDKAASDENIKGIFLDLSSLNTGIASVEEIHNALAKFRQSGKFIIAYADYYTQKTYYLASIANEIYVNPAGGMEFVGLSAQLMFFKNALEKFGIKPVIIRHGKFKSAVEPFMLDKMSEANREQTQTYISSIWNTMINDISVSRNISTEELNKIADSLLLKNNEAAKNLGFIDGTLYRDELMNLLKDKVKAEKVKDIKFVSIHKYNKVPKKKKEGEKALAKDKIAIIYASGEITTGKSTEKTMGSETVVEALKKAREDKKVKAIVLRINSPGGSALASDIIWRETVLAKEKKPLIVSMGDLAASWGYYIACAADTIVASSNTLTGSIGVFGLLFNVKKLMNEKIGITFDKVNTNKYSDIGSSFKDMSEEERAFIQNGVEDIYGVFIEHVAEGRGMSVAEVDSIGQGRVWSGTNAMEIGLVDVIGGLQKAVEIAAEKAGLEHYRIKPLPAQKEPFEEFLEELTGDAAKAKIFGNEENEFSMMYDYYKTLSNMKGVQARLPFEIIIN
ncbi:MAG: signal peptide peptidase SppA [Bacteroidales bacterium]|nr:signal peptide peptidase SppA [Bacteroidales bacterium]